MKKVIVIVCLLVLSGCSGNSKEGKFDDFATCMTEAGAKMYGAFWCGNCKQQKHMFGKSIRHIEYIECSTANKQDVMPVCQEAGVSGYPTWVFEDGSRLVGLQTFEILSQYSGCKV